MQVSKVTPYADFWDTCTTKTMSIGMIDAPSGGTTQISADRSPVCEFVFIFNFFV
jgi:hypothetical protein